MYAAEDVKFFLDLRYGCDIAAFGVAGGGFIANIAIIVTYFHMQRTNKKLVPNFIFFAQSLVGFLVSTCAVLSTLPNFVTVGDFR